jgi:hypothetical protein
MATEILFEAYVKYIEPLLNFGFITTNNDGLLVEREKGVPLRYINDKYSGAPDEVPVSYPVIPLNDGHYLAIRDNPEQQLFNPFSSIKHMQLVVIQFKRGLINHCLSENVSDDLTLTQQEDLIQFYYNEYLDNQYIVGFSNVEDKENPKDLYTYIAKDFIEAMWGLCVKAYNDVDRRHNDYFYTIDKTWAKILRLMNKWENERKLIIPKIKTEHQSDFGFQHIDLSDSANTNISEYNRNDYIRNEDVDIYLTSLFQPHELIDAVASDDTVYPIGRKETTWQLPDFATDEVIFRKAREELKKSKIASNEDDIIEAEIIEEELVPEINKEKEPEKGEANVPLLIENIELNKPPKPPPQVVYNPGKSQMPPSFNPLGMPGQAPMYPPGYSYPGMSQYPYNQMGPPMHNVPQDINQIDFESIDHPDPFSSYR